MDFLGISILVATAGIFGLFAKILKQPLLVGYLFSGIFLATTGIFEDSESLKGLAQIGVTLLLFLMGMEMSIRHLPTIGKTAIVAGLAQVSITSLLVFLLSRMLGFSSLASVYIGVSLTFASTIIIVKLLSDKKDLGSLYGQISLGILLFQDVVAILILTFLSGLGGEGSLLNNYLFIAAKAIVLIFSVWLLSKYVVPKLFEKFLATNNELLFIGSLAWAFGLAGLVSGPLGFTLEIGGFLAGISLSSLPEHLQIVTRTRPLRDFFLTIFFLTLGMELIRGTNILLVLPLALLFSFFIFVAKPIILMSILGFLGYKKRTSFLTGLTFALVSEFSFIIMAVGHSLGHLSSFEVSLVVLTGVITMTLSTYMITGSDRIYSKLSKFISIFERKTSKEKVLLVKTDLKNHIVLVGCDRTGSSILSFLKTKKYSFIVVDFNPRVFSWLSAERVPIIFGDINDEDIQDAANIRQAGMVISTISDFPDNMILLESLKSINPNVVSLFTTTERREAVRLYEKGATFVVVPEVLAGDYIKTLLRLRKDKKEKWLKLGKSHFNKLILT